AEFGGDFRGPARIRVDNPNQFRAVDFAPDANMVAAEFSDANHGDAYGFLAHAFFSASALDAAFALSGATAWIAMPASSAARMSVSLSNSSVRRASTASAEALASR